MNEVDYLKGICAYISDAIDVIANPRGNEEIIINSIHSLEEVHKTRSCGESEIKELNNIGFKFACKIKAQKPPSDAFSVVRMRYGYNSDGIGCSCYSIIDGGNNEYRSQFDY